MLGRSEPAFNAPWPALTLAALLVAFYAAQSTLAGPGAADRYGFSPAELQQGRWSGLITSLFVHGGWAHVLLNALGALAFGAPVARLFGTRAGGGLLFFAFFLVCGVISGLGFAAVHLQDAIVVVGASGGISGLMGAASRMIDRGTLQAGKNGEGRALAPFTSRSVVSMGVSWVAVNLAVGFVGLGVVSGGAPVAWEAHLFGYAAGLLLVGPVVRMTAITKA